MGLTIKLYNNESPVEKIGKSLTGELAISDVVLKRNEYSSRPGVGNTTSVLRPVLIISSNQAIYSYNYMYITEFERYYFIDDIRSVYDNRWEVSGHVDVLETYKTGILANSAVIRRQSKIFNTYLNDPEWKVYANEDVVAFKMTSPFSKQLKYVLAVAGS